MAKRKRATTEATIARRIREGRGRGTGASYRPWLSVRDVPSQGLAHRIQGWTTGRVHHLFSNLERDYFYVLDWSPTVVDIREQCPLLPLEETQAIAGQIGVRHPANPKTQNPVVMTTDFVVDIQHQGQPLQLARTVKLSAMLSHQRTLAKLEIERLYWQARDIDWGIVTEHEIPAAYACNIRHLHGYRDIDDRVSAAVNISAIIQMLLNEQHNRTIGDLAQYGDALFDVVSGTTLTVLYHLLATQQIQADLFLPLTVDTQLVSREAVLA
jgi:hypothetical protein